MSCMFAFSDLSSHTQHLTASFDSGARSLTAEAWPIGASVVGKGTLRTIRAHISDGLADSLPDFA